MRVLELTEKEFELIQEGLDSLPKLKDVSFDTAYLTMRVMTKDSPEMTNALEESMLERRAKHTIELKQLENRVVMVKAKLLGWKGNE